MGWLALAGQERRTVVADAIGLAATQVVLDRLTPCVEHGTDMPSAAEGTDACRMPGGIHAPGLYGSTAVAAEEVRRGGLDPLAAVWAFRR